MHTRALTSMLLFLCAPLLNAQEKPALSGIVTDAGTPAEFQVNGAPVLCVEGQTRTDHKEGERLVGTTRCPQHFLGEELIINGRRDKRRGPVVAEAVTAIAPQDIRVDGSALTDVVVSKGPKEVVVRADGYLLHITPDTKITYEGTLKPNFEAFETNEWISYQGTEHPDGTVMVQKASLSPNVITDGEDRLRNKTDFDASTVTDADRQSKMSKFFTGTDRTRIPATDDPALQARVNTIGNRLIPAYQRALPGDDPSKSSSAFN